MNLNNELLRMKRREEAKVHALASTQGTVLKCLEKKCKYETEGNLTSHVRRTHGLSKTQYLLRHRLPMNTRLYGEKLGEHYRAAGNIMAYHKKKRGQ